MKINGKRREEGEVFAETLAIGNSLVARGILEEVSPIPITKKAIAKTTKAVATVRKAVAKAKKKGGKG